jgi:hypothetical protein
MDQDTGHTPVRVSLAEARDIAIRLRAGLAALGVPDGETRQIIPASDIDGGHYVRMGTWDPASAAILAEHLTRLPAGS